MIVVLQCGLQKALPFTATNQPTTFAQRPSSRTVCQLTTQVDLRDQPPFLASSNTLEAGEGVQPSSDANVPMLEVGEGPFNISPSDSPSSLDFQ
jgi:hypothetical protein